MLTFGKCVLLFLSVRNCSKFFFLLFLTIKVSGLGVDRLGVIGPQKVLLLAMTNRVQIPEVLWSLQRVLQVFHLEIFNS